MFSDDMLNRMKLVSELLLKLIVEETIGVVNDERVLSAAAEFGDYYNNSYYIKIESYF